MVKGGGSGDVKVSAASIWTNWKFFKEAFIRDQKEMGVKGTVCNI